MNTDAPGKVRSHHLGRNAYLYVRQSSLRQVLEHTESTERQYALKQRAIANLTVGTRTHHTRRQQAKAIRKDSPRPDGASVREDPRSTLDPEVSLGRFHRSS